MNDPLLSAFRSEQDALAEQAPAPEFPALWREVGVRRERRLQRLLVLAAGAPTLLLFLGGLVSLVLGGGLMSGLPLLGVAFWLVVGGVEFPPLPAGERDSREAAG
jgi:type IV secretory pathway TrbD component